MAELATALALVLVIEGCLYALFPEQMQRMMAQAIELPAKSLRTLGLAVAIVGFAVVWFIRS